MDNTKKKLYAIAVLLWEVETEDPAEYILFMRMHNNQFDDLLQNIAQKY